MLYKEDHKKKHYAPMKEKTLKNALAHKIGQEFPRIGGKRILQLCAEMVLEVLDKHLRPKQLLQHGQVLWMGISVNDPPARHKKTADCDLVPVILDLSCAQDVEDRIGYISKQKRLQKKAVRMCRQSFQQGALLSDCDLAELLNINDSYVASLLTDHERITGTLVPRRANLHDVGSGITHKRIICLKRYRDGKTSDQIALETYHSLEAVDHYLGQFDRVRHCLQQGLNPQEISFTLNCSVSLVNEYLSINEELVVKK